MSIFDLECLNSGDSRDKCEGLVEYRMALSATGRSFPRCAKHWEEALKRWEADSELRSDVAPSWVDESYAGERWDDN